MCAEKAPRPKAKGVEGVTYKLEAGCADMFVILNDWEGEGHREMFLKCGPQGSCSAAIMNALSVLFSYARRCGVPLTAISGLFSRNGGFCGKGTGNGKKTCIAVLGDLFSSLVEGGEEGYAIGAAVEMERSPRTRLTGCGPMEIICGWDSGSALRHVDISLAQTNTCAHTIADVLARLISLMLGYGVESKEIIKGLIGIRCPASREDNFSCIDGIAKAISDYEGLEYDREKKEFREVPCLT